jgi:hypothetical protein
MREQIEVCSRTEYSVPWVYFPASFKGTST